MEDTPRVVRSRFRKTATRWQDCLPRWCINIVMYPKSKVITVYVMIEI
jgi:hypothetical protein